MKVIATHEHFTGESSSEGSSDRSFCMVMAVFFLLVGLRPLIGSGRPRIWSLAVAAILALVGVVQPRLLHKLNLLWIALGILLAKIVNPLVMGAVYYLAITPAAFIMRLTGKDPMQRRYDKQADSYWIARQPPGPPPDTMSNPF